MISAGLKSATLLFLCLQVLFTEARVLNVRKFGARGDGKTDDTKSVQAALDAAGKMGSDTVFFPKGVYLFRSYKRTTNYLENYFLQLYPGITILGNGKSTVLKIAPHLFDITDSNANAHLFFGKELQRIRFKKFSIDMNGHLNRVPKGFIKNHCAIFIDSGENVQIEGVEIKNCAGRNMIIIKGQGHDVDIRNSRFLNGGCYVGNPRPNEHQDDFSFIYSEWDHTHVINNIIRQMNPAAALYGYSGGIELHGSYSRAANNLIEGCYPGIYISSSWYPLTGTVIENNKILQCVKGVSFWVHYPLDSIRIIRNTITLRSATRNNPPVISGVEVPNGNASVYGFKQANNAPISNTEINGNIIEATNELKQVKSAGMLLHSLRFSLISENYIKNMNYAGIVLQGSKWGTDSLRILRNSFSAFNTNPDSAAVGGIFVITDSYSADHATEEAPGIKRIFIEGNKFNTDNSGLQVAHKKSFFGAFVALPEKMQKEVHLVANSFGKTEAEIRRVNTD